MGRVYAKTGNFYRNFVLDLKVNELDNRIVEVRGMQRDLIVKYVLEREYDTILRGGDVANEDEVLYCRTE